jgi:hypothetical protein
MIVALLALALASDPQVFAVIREPVRVFDKDGAPIGTRADSTFKGLLPLKIEGFNARQQPGVKIDGVVIYLKAADVQTKNVTGVCVSGATPTPSPGTHLAATSVGAGAGLATSSSRCVPPPPK